MEKDKQCSYDLMKVVDIIQNQINDKIQKHLEIHFTYEHRRKNPKINIFINNKSGLVY